MFSAKKNIHTFLVLSLPIFLWITGCNKKNDPTVFPEITTLDVADILQQTATAGGNITSDGDQIIISRGVCWDTESGPTINKNFTDNGNGSGVFTSKITNLQPGKKYYLRAYATNSNGTAYGSTMVFTTADTLLTDIEGNVYKTIQIGTQIWMAENLETTKLNDNTLLNNYFTNSIAGASTYCWFQNDKNNKQLYGAYYNSTAKNTGLLSPKGWHIPTTSDWNLLFNYLGGANVAGGKMKITGIKYWSSPNTGATNASGFAAIGGGFLNGDTENMESVLLSGSWWISDSDLIITLSSNSTGTSSMPHPWSEDHYPVRCIKD